MEHVVFFPGPDGGPAFRRVGSLDEAVAWVERLRNVDDLTDFSVHALTEVPLSVRAYYKVQVPELVEPVELADLPELPVQLEDLDDVEAAESFAALPAEAVPAQVTPDYDDESVSVETAPRPGLGFFTS